MISFFYAEESSVVGISPAGEIDLPEYVFYDVTTIFHAKYAKRNRKRAQSSDLTSLRLSLRTLRELFCIHLWVILIRSIWTIKLNALAGKNGMMNAEKCKVSPAGDKWLMEKSVWVRLFPRRGIDKYQWL